MNPTFKTILKFAAAAAGGSVATIAGQWIARKVTGKSTKTKTTEERTTTRQAS